jgi:hypothetical protein
MIVTLHDADADADDAYADDGYDDDDENDDDYDGADDDVQDCPTAAARIRCQFPG